MAEAYEEKMLENISSKLKENITNYEKNMLPVNKKIDDLFQIIHEIMDKNETEQDMKRVLYLILIELQNIRDHYTHNMSTVIRNYDTYLCFLESLLERGETTGESVKIVRQEQSNEDMASLGAKFLSHQTSNDLAIVTEKKPKTRSELLKFP